MDSACTDAVCTYNGEIVKWPGVLNVLKRLLQIPQLLVDNALRLLSALDGLGLEGLDRLDLPVHIVCLGLEGIVALLDLIDDGGVLEDRAVVGEIDSLRLLGEHRYFAACIVIALLERLKGGSSVAFEAQLRSNLGPVKLEGGAALRLIDELVFLFPELGTRLRR